MYFKVGLLLCLSRIYFRDSMFATLEFIQKKKKKQVYISKNQSLIIYMGSSDMENVIDKTDGI